MQAAKAPQVKLPQLGFDLPYLTAEWRYGFREPRQKHNNSKSDNAQQDGGMVKLAVHDDARMKSDVESD